MTRRIFRVHQNGRTILPWITADGEFPDIPLFNSPRDSLKIRFGYKDSEMSEVDIDGYPAFRFWEVKLLPVNAFAKIEFLYNNDLWQIEYRREIPFSPPPTELPSHMEQLKLAD